MPIPVPKPSNERSRQHALERLQILDTLPETVFDNVTRLAAQICRTPIALISLIDQEREWFKAHHGWDEVQKPRDESFCAYAILGDSIFEVPDAAVDPRFRDLPIVRDDPRVRFYAGVPLVAATGEHIGAICVLDVRPNALDDDQKRALGALAEQVIALMEARLALKQSHALLARERAAERARADADRRAESDRARLLRVFEQIPEPIATLRGSDHTYAFMNKPFRDAFFDGRDVTGRRVVDVLPEAARQGLVKILDTVFATGEKFVGKETLFALPTADGVGRKIYLDFFYDAMVDGAGRVEGILCAAVNVTERVVRNLEAEESRAQLKSLLERTALAETRLQEAVDVAAVGFFEWDLVADQLTMSEQFSTDWGTERDVTTKWGILARVWAEDRDRVARAIDEAVSSKTHFDMEFRVQRPGDQRVIWVEVNGRVDYDGAGQPRRVFGTSVDVTARKSVEHDTRALADAIPQLAWMTDPTGAISWYNQRWYEYTGTTLAQMKGWGWRDVHDPAELPRVLEKFVRHVASGEPWEDTFPIRAADGTFRWFLSRANPIRDDAGNITRWFGTNTDVTEQRETARNLAQLAAIVESSTDFIAMADENFTPVMLNAAGRAMIGFGDQPLARMHFADFFDEGDRARIAGEVLTAAREKGVWQGELSLRHRGDGRAIPVIHTLFRVRDPASGETIAFATVTRDISERKAFERSLESARVAAERANDAKSAFLANMSHEIRSPLGAIMGFSQLLRSSEQCSPDALDFIAVIERNAQHLLRIIDDILDISKVEAGRMLVEKIGFSLIDALADFSSLMGVRARERRIEFELEVLTPLPDLVISDPTRLRQILTNAVGNAIKFTERGRVTLSVRLDQNRLELTITDTGLGISPAQAASLFRPFQQADVSTTRRFGGTGLGLMLTRRLAELMGGGFELVRSTVGRGSVFRAWVDVELPAGYRMVDRITAGGPPARPGEPELARPRGRALHVLLIEDSPDNQLLIKLLLTKMGATVEIAGDGVEGVEKARAREYDLIICDVQMPRLDGYAVVKELGRLGHRVPIVALTAHAMKEERDRALGAGFSGYLTKPIEPRALAAVLERYGQSPRDAPAEL